MVETRTIRAGPDRDFQSITLECLNHHIKTEKQLIELCLVRGARVVISQLISDGYFSWRVEAIRRYERYGPENYWFTQALPTMSPLKKLNLTTLFGMYRKLMMLNFLSKCLSKPEHNTMNLSDEEMRSLDYHKVGDSSLVNADLVAVSSLQDELNDSYKSHVAKYSVDFQVWELYDVMDSLTKNAQSDASAAINDSYGSSLDRSFSRLESSSDRLVVCELLYAICVENERVVLSNASRPDELILRQTEADQIKLNEEVGLAKIKVSNAKSRVLYAAVFTGLCFGGLLITSLSVACFCAGPTAATTVGTIAAPALFALADITPTVETNFASDLVTTDNTSSAGNAAESTSESPNNVSTQTDQVLEVSAQTVVEEASTSNFSTWFKRMGLEQSEGYYSAIRKSSEKWTLGLIAGTIGGILVTSGLGIHLVELTRELDFKIESSQIPSTAGKVSNLEDLDPTKDIRYVSMMVMLNQQQQISKLKEELKSLKGSL